MQAGGAHRGGAATRAQVDQAPSGLADTTGLGHNYSIMLMITAPFVLACSLVGTLCFGMRQGAWAAGRRGSGPGHGAASGDDAPRRS